MKCIPDRFQMKLLASAIACLSLSHASFAQTTKATDLGTVRIAGEGDNLGAGQMIEEDGAKGRSTVTKAAIDKARPSSNPYQLLNLQPGVNAYSFDATGLFGGNLRIRGFNSDQLGFTINGAPVNDSGNFAVFPQEYADVENLCEIFVTQGSADTDAPHVGASGGNVGLVSCGPNDNFGGKASFSLGQLNFRRAFLRVDTGAIGANRQFKAFVSVSHAETDKFKGPGKAKRDHLDAGIEWKLTSDTAFTANLLYNNAVNNNYMTVTKAQFATNPNADFTTNVPQHLASGNENTTANFAYNNVTGPAAYYGYSLNPFENYLITSRLQSRINEKLTLSAEPYFWYGYGTGGTQQVTLTENTSSGTRLGNGIGDINRNGLLTDTVGVYRGSVTETHRPGITLKANYAVANHRILAGYWFEQVNHKQTQPATTVDNSGNIADLWLRGSLVTLNNGALYQGRDYTTKSIGQSAFVTDTVSLDGERLKLMPAIRHTTIKRDFENRASLGTGLGADYSVSRSYGRTLPSLGATYKLSEPLQVFGNVTRNMRAPSNFVLSGWVSAVTYANGAVASSTLNPNNAIVEETSTNFEGGLRYFGEHFNAQGTVFRTNFQNRIASAFNPTTTTVTDYNVGDTRMQGVEFQAGSKPYKGWSFFGSATYTDSKMLSDLATQKSGAAYTLATSGMVFPDTPKTMLAAVVQYTEGPVMAALSGKFVGKRYTTLANDEFLDGYHTFDFDAGYRLPFSGWMKSPTIRLNVTNILNKRYLLANSGSGGNITTTLDSTVRGGGSPSYYVGAPRFASISFSAEF